MSKTSVEIIADSLSPAGTRLTTFIWRHQRFIHAETLRHRSLSFCAASSRAIPSKKFLEMVRTDPAMPSYWGENQAGMSAATELDDVHKVFVNTFPGEDQGEITKREYAKRAWKKLGMTVADAVEKTFGVVGLHKQIANRCLEPWLQMEVLVSGTEWGNLFALRCHKDAQPEFQNLADATLRAYCLSTPKPLDVGAFHIPFKDAWFDNLDLPEDQKIKIAIARCARVSYSNFDGKKEASEDLALYDKLMAGTNGVRHLSPAEHVAEALATPERFGNFTGFKQWRYRIPGQCMSVDPHALLAKRIAEGSKYASGEL